MKIACEACAAKYTIGDDKVRGRRVKVRCKGCGTPIVVEGNQNSDSAVPDEPGAARQPLSIPPPDRLPFEQDASNGAAAASTEPWSVNLSDTEQRDMTTDELVAAWRSG